MASPELPLGDRTEFRLDGRSALVTGGGTNLGFAMAFALASRGCRVTVLGRNESRLARAAARLNDESSLDHTYIAGDLLEDSTYEAVARSGINFDILVNDAGGGDAWDGVWLEQSSSDWLNTLHLNVVAVNRMCQMVAPSMIEQGWGRIINISSIFGVVAPDIRGRADGMEGAAYTASKHAVIGLTRFRAARLGKHGITINAISPGRFPLHRDDPARQGRPGNLPSADLETNWHDLTPLGRNGVPTELGGAAVFLASEHSSFVTGQNLVVDGGWTVW